MRRITYRPSRTKTMNRLLNREGIASIRSSLETCIRLGKYALPICAQVAAFTSTRSQQKLLLQLLTVSAELVFFPCIFVARKLRLHKKQIIHIVFQLR
jgi:hypothetical protein